MIFSKTKKAEEENRKLRYIKLSLRLFLVDYEEARSLKKFSEHTSKYLKENNKKMDEMMEEKIYKMIEYRAKEILDWT